MVEPSLLLFERASFVMALASACVGLRHVVVVLADVLESRRRAVVAVADDHLVLHHQSPHLPADAVGVLGPYTGHAQIALVQLL